MMIVRRNYHANLRTQLAAILISMLLVSGCVHPGPLGGSLFGNRADTGLVTYDNPPTVRSYLPPQSGMVICEEMQSAIAMALTGFFLDTCSRLEQVQTWRVVSVTHRDMGNGQSLWLAEVVSMRQGTAETITMWAPIPWHDWA